VPSDWNVNLAGVPGSGPAGPPGPPGTPGPPADVFVATLSADQTGVVAATWTKVNFNTAVYNQNGKFNASTSRWTPSAGPVQVEAQIVFTVATTVYAAIYKNGVALRQMPIGSQSRITVTDNANGTDYYEAWIYTTVAGAVSSNTVNSFFQGFAIAPAGPQGPVGPVAEAPTDGQQYARQNAAWSVVGAAAAVPSSGKLTYVNATTLKFAPYNGDLIKINGVIYQIPAAGIAGLSTAGVFLNGVAGQNLAGATLYYVYCFNNGGTLTADFSTTGHATSTTTGNVGIEIKSGDNTRSLIGLIYVSGSPVNFYDQNTARWVRSWFNPTTAALSIASAGSLNATSGWVASTGVVQWVQFAGELTFLRFTGAVYFPSATNMYQTMYVDGVGAGGTGTCYSNATWASFAMEVQGSYAEGFHSSQAMYQATVATSNMAGSLNGSVSR
jgi:hypothetical protein